MPVSLNIADAKSSLKGLNNKGHCHNLTVLIQDLEDSNIAFCTEVMPTEAP